MVRGNSSRHGVARRDVVIGVVIVGLFAGLIVTALNSIREKAGQSSCTNNLKQIGLAVHNFNDSVYHLPHNGGHTDPDKLQSINFGWHNSNVKESGTWAMMIHPFMENDPMWRQVQLKGEGIDIVPIYLSQSQHDHEWQFAIKNFHCPQRIRTGFKTSRANGSLPGIVTDYAINSFLNDPPRSYAGPEGFATSGGLACKPNSKQSIQGIPGGSNNIILVGQKALSSSLMNSDDANHGDEGIFSPGHYIADGKNSRVISTGTARSHRIDPQFTGTGDQAVNPANGGVPWMYRDSELSGRDVPDFASDWGGPFRGGVLFLFADGTVRMVNYNLKGTVTFARMLTTPGVAPIPD